MRCGAETRSGERCKRRALAGRKVCQAHDPDRVTGRPSKLTPRVHAAIVDAIRDGSYVETAAEAGGISKATFYHWMERGEADEAGEFSDFFYAVRAASAQAEIDAVRQLRAAAERSWQAAVAFLERRFPERWGRSERTDVEEIQPRIQVVWDYAAMTTDELRALRDLMERYQRVEEVES